MRELEAIILLIIVLAGTLTIMWVVLTYLESVAKKEEQDNNRTKVMAICYSPRYKYLTWCVEYFKANPEMAPGDLK